MRSLLMVWNNSAPEPFQFKPFKRWKLNKPAGYWREACAAFLNELKTRELTVEQAATLSEMRTRARSIWPDCSNFLK